MLRPRALLDFRVGRANDGLNLGAVDETGDVGVGDLRGREAERIFSSEKHEYKEDRAIQVVLLVDRRLLEGAENLIK